MENKIALMISLLCCLTICLSACGNSALIANAYAAEPTPVTKADTMNDKGATAMSDYEALTSLTLWERQSRVRHLQKDLADCYWPDATVTISWTSGSAGDYLNAGNAGSRRAEASSEEVILNRSCAPIVHQRGNRAYVELPTESNHWIRVNGEEAVWTSYMQLLYRCEKRDGVWKIVDMTSVFDSDKLAPAVPGTDLHVDPNDLKGLRHSYRWLAYIRIRAGGSVSQDLPGTDRSDELEKVYKNAEAWMNGGANP